MVERTDRGKGGRGVAFALGGLAGNNAHGAGFLQAALDHGARPDLISCTSGQIFWVYRYLLARAGGAGGLEGLLAEDIAEVERFHQPDADLAYMSLFGRPGVFRLASYEIALDAYKNMLSAFVDMAHNWGHTFYLKAFLGAMPARTMVPLFADEFFAAVSEALNGSDVAILFNSYEPRQGIEFVHLNAAARARLGLEPGARKSYRDRTIYKGITPQYVRDGLWIYQYGFDERFTAIDGAYYRQILLSELADAATIFVARLISHKWAGDLPRSFIALEDMKTEIAFNGSYQGERDKLLLINKLVREGALDRGRYHEVELVEVELETQESFFDYVFEKMAVFRAAREKAAGAFRGAREDTA